MDKDKVLHWAEKIYMEGWVTGFQQALTCFDWRANNLRYLPANIATHVAGTEAPLEESWQKMKEREDAAGRIVK